MPYPYLTNLAVWIESCQRETLGGTMRVENGKYENCIIQIITGHCIALYNEESHLLCDRSIVFLGRNTVVNFTTEADKTCRYLMMRFCNTQTSP